MCRLGKKSMASKSAHLHHLHFPLPSPSPFRQPVVVLHLSRISTEDIKQVQEALNVFVREQLSKASHFNIMR